MHHRKTKDIKTNKYIRSENGKWLKEKRARKKKQDWKRRDQDELKKNKKKKRTWGTHQIERNTITIKSSNQLNQCLGFVRRTISHQFIQKCANKRISISIEWLSLFLIWNEAMWQTMVEHRYKWMCGDIAEEEESERKKSNRISKRLKFVGGCEHYASIILIHTYRSLNRRYGKKKKKNKWRNRRRKIAKDSVKMRSNWIPTMPIRGYRYLVFFFFFLGVFCFCARLIHVPQSPVITFWTDICFVYGLFHLVPVSLSLTLWYSYQFKVIACGEKCVNANSIIKCDFGKRERHKRRKKK